MLTRLKKLIDRSAIDLAAKSLAAGVPNPSKACVASELLENPDFLMPSSDVAMLTFGPKESFQFASPHKCDGRNAIVHGRIFRAGEFWATRPFVTLVHGWNAELHYLYVLPRVARALNRAGLNAALIELPYHLHRRPAEQNTMRDFISDDLPGMLQATKQALADIHSLNLWARKQGCPSVAVWGFSLGAWLAGLYICESPLPGAAILTTPVSDLARAVSELAFCHPIRSGLAGSDLDLSPLNLRCRHPKIPPEKIRLVQSVHDLFVPTETYAELADAWKLNGWEKQPQGHISILISPRAMRQSIDWLSNELTSTSPTCPC